MKRKMIGSTIVRVGSYLATDKRGYIINDTSVTKIQRAWRKPIHEMVCAYKSHFSNNLHSVYVRGSVVRGEAIKGVSDIDSFAILLRASADIDQQWTDSFRSSVERGCKQEAAQPPGLWSAAPLSHEP